MEFEELLRLVREVGQAGLSNFEYNEGNVHIKMSALPADPDGGDRDYEVETNLKIQHEKSQERETKRELIDAPVEGVFHFCLPDETPCPLAVGDQIKAGQILGMLDSRGQRFPIESGINGQVAVVYIEDGEELVTGEPMFMIASYVK